MKINVFLVSCFFALFPFALNSKSIMPGLDRMKEKVQKAVDDANNKINFKDYLEQKNNGDHSAKKSEVDVDVQVKNLYWCKQTDLIKILELKKDNKNESAAVLKGYLDKKYESNKKEILFFAGDIIAEKSMIECLITQNMKNMQTINVDDKSKMKNKEIFNQLVAFNMNISRLIELVGDLLSL